MEEIKEQNANTEVQTLDGILESAIAGELEINGEQSTPKETQAVDEKQQEEAEVSADPSSDETAEEVSDVGDSELSPDQEDNDLDPEPKHISAPKTWPEEQRESFEPLPEDQQQFLLKREKERDAAFTRKTTELAEQRKQVQPISDVLAPYEQRIRSAGLSNAEFVHRQIALGEAMTNDPVGTLVEAARQYQVSDQVAHRLGSSVSGVAQPEANNPQQMVDPHVQQLQQQVHSHAQVIAEMEQNRYRESVGQLVDSVERFIQEKNQDGSLKYPYYEELKHSMAELIQGKIASNLVDAYSKAELLNVDVSQEKQRKAIDEVAKKEETRRLAAVEKAKRAKPTTSSNSPPKGSVKVTDLDGLLRGNIESVLSP